MRSRNVPFRILAAGVGLTAAGSLALVPPAAADTNTYQVVDGPGAVVGSATVSRQANAVSVSVTLSTGNRLDATIDPNTLVCASTQAFTSRVNPAQCKDQTTTPGGEAFSFQGSGSSETVSFNLGGSYTNQPAYLQIHLNTVDGGVQNTSEVNPVANSVPLYGNVPTDPLPVEAMGGFGLAALAGAFLAVKHRRHRRTVKA